MRTGEAVLHFDEPEHLVAGLISRGFHVVDADLPEAQRFHERVHDFVMRDGLMRGRRGRRGNRSEARKVDLFAIDVRNERTVLRFLFSC